MFWKDKKVLVTGGAGFIGSHLVKRLVREGSIVKVVDNLERGRLENVKDVLSEIEFVKADLTEWEKCLRAVDDVEIVFHLAARLGGIVYMSPEAGAQSEVYTANVLMNTYMLEAARRQKVDRYCFTSTACIYPEEKQMHPDCPPLREADAYPAHPDSTYGWAKLMGEIQAQSYVREHGIRVSIVRMFNVYGEHEDLRLERAHVIPALIHKAIAYPKTPFIVLGTGEQTRAFLYVSDAVEGMLLATEKNMNPEPINIGSDKRVTIGELAERIIDVSGKDIKPIYDPSKPVGVHGRAADWGKAEKIIGWKPKVSLKEGLERTYKWAEQALLEQQNEAS